MKHAALRHLSAGSRPARSRRPDHPADAYLSLAETRAMLTDSLAGRMARLAEGDMLSTEEAALLNGTTRVTVNAWISKGRAIGLTQNTRGFRLPRWQFEPRLWDALPRLAEALDTREGWALLTFLETPLGALQGLTPRAAIERGDADRVVQLATHTGG